MCIPTLSISIGILDCVAHSMTKQRWEVLWNNVDEKCITGVEAVIDDSNVNYRGESGKTPLHVAALRLFPEAIHLLLMYGADVNATDDSGQTPLHCVKYGEEDSVCIMHQLCLAGARVDARDMKSRTPLHVNADRTHNKMNIFTDMQYLIDAGSGIEAKDCDGKTALHITAKDGLSSVAQILLKNWANPDTCDLWGNTPLFLESDDYYEPTSYLDTLLEKGANINVRNDVGDTPLHRACSENTPVYTWVRALVEVGADVNAKNGVGDTPLHKVSLLRWTEITTFLLANGADTLVRNNLDCTPGMQPTHPSPCGHYEDGGTSIANFHVLRIEEERRARCIAFGSIAHGLPREQMQAYSR